MFKVTHIVVCNFSPPKLSRCDEGSQLVASNKNTVFVFQQYIQLVISLTLYAFAVSVDNTCRKLQLVKKTKNNEKKVKKLANKKYGQITLDNYPVYFIHDFIAE